jgi:hypothetical protein
MFGADGPRVELFGFISRMLCLRWALYLRSMTPHVEAVGIKTYCIETALPQGRNTFAIFVVAGFVVCVCAWPPEASPGSGLTPVIRDPISQFIILARSCVKTDSVRFSVVVFHARRSGAKIIAQLGGELEYALRASSCGMGGEHTSQQV